jgi:hypothetical protein
MIGVVQVAFIGLIILNYIQPLLVPLMNITLINGINTYLNPVKSSVI